MFTKRNLFYLLGTLLIVSLVGCAAPAENGENGDTTTDTEPERESFGASVDYNIVGIEPGAGIMINTDKVMEAYNLEEAGWNLQESSSAAMLTAMQDAVENNEPIVATVWEPHAIFSIAEIRKLNDPQNIYNSPSQTKAFLEENAPDWADAQVASDVIASVVYKGFADDAPAAYEFLQNFNVDSDVQSDWIYSYSVENKEAGEVAAEYVENNSEAVSAWLPEDAELGKEKIIIGIPPWPGATVKSRVVALLLQDLGYETEIKELDAGVVYTSVSQKDIDVNVAGWLPTTHQDYWESNKDKLEIAGINVTQTWLGLGIPDYVSRDFQSINDLAQ